MNKMPLLKGVLVTLILLMIQVGCFSPPGTPYVEIPYTPPPTPTTLEEAIELLTNGYPDERIAAARSVSQFGEDAVQAVPALAQNLHYETDGEVRMTAASILGVIGADAQDAVPDLIDALQNDSFVNVRSTAAWALGQIGAASAIPVLADHLYYDPDDNEHNYQGIAIECAASIALLTGERFTDAGGSGYRINDNGIPYIVLDAREWWEEEGQYQDW